MENQAEFLKKLQELVVLAGEQGNRIQIEKVKAHFSKENLTSEQMDLVFDYLLSQKVVVQGYVKMTEESAETEVTYSEDEKAYLEEYLQDLQAFRPETKGEREELYVKKLNGDAGAKNRLTELYLKDVVEIAKEMYHPEIFLGDLIQEGNVGLILGLDLFEEEKNAHQVITEQIRQSIRTLIDEYNELSQRDRQMVEQVSMLDEAIKSLTEELGRKVSIEELSFHLGMTEEEINDILRLMGEDSDEEEQGSEEH